MQFAIIWYVTLETGSGGSVAMISAASYIPQFLISFFAGVRADRYPRKRLIIAADGAIALSTLAFVLLLPQIPRRETVYVALVVMAVNGVALTMVQTASTTLLPENSAPEMAGRIFGLYGADFSSCLPIGMVVFGLLADKVSMRLLMVLSGVC